MSITSHHNDKSAENQGHCLWDAPIWYQAATLRERLHAPSFSQLLLHSSTLDLERGQARLQFWQEDSPLQQDASFANRLALDAQDEAGLLALLSEPPEHLQMRLANTPFTEWLTELQLAFESQQADDASLPSLFRDQDPRRRTLAEVVSTVRPLLTHAFNHLQKEIASLQERYQDLPFDPASVANLFFPTLAQQVYTLLVRTLTLEMHVARLQGDLQGESSEDRFHFFLRQLAEKERILSLLEEYPVLARQLVCTVDHWVSFSLEVLTHLCHDWQDIYVHLSAGEDLGLLSLVHGNEGDSHREGRRVVKLTFTSGRSLIYKPKSLAVDIHFQELLAWCNQQGETLPFRITRLLDKGSYGWSECIYARSCSSEAEIERFYERQGSYLALLYVLQATDLHIENVIAAGEHPMLIDLETLLHPHIEQIPPEQPGLEAIKASVQRIALLPRRVRSAREADAVDMSGLGGRKGQLFPYRVPVWKDRDTDQMHIVKERVEVSRAQNQPRLHDHEVNLLDYLTPIITGFTRMYRLLALQRDTLLTEILPRFAHDEIRIVLRPTFAYGMLLTDMRHPDLLHDALDTERAFDRLWIPAEQQPHLKQVISAERADLLNGDIPMFTSHPASQALFTSQGTCIQDFCTESGLETACKCIRSLGESDLDRQVWFIRASFATLQTVDDRRVNQVLTLEPPSNVPSSTLQPRLLSAACSLGDRLCHMAINNHEQATWVGVTPIKDNEWGITVAGADLYNGVSGIVFFLAYLGALTGNTAYTEQGRLALQTLRQQHMAQLSLHAETFPIGAFSGWGSLIYLLSHLGSLWSDRTLLYEAEQLVETIRPCITQDTHFDIIAGSAGCIAALMSLYAVHPSQQVLECALACGQHLLDQVQVMPEGVGWQTIPETPPLSGFSHGASGIALSLCRLAAVSGETRFRQLAQAALAYERSLFLPELQNWLDVRDLKQPATPIPPDKRTMTAWCHGAAGIGLARFALREFLGDATIAEETRIALKTTMKTGFGWNHSLCHGDLGNLETVLTASQSLDDLEYHQQLEKRTEQLLSSIEKTGWVTSGPCGVETPGLMSGLAGIGYELLRLAEPQHIPSLLLLSPPIV